MRPHPLGLLTISLALLCLPQPSGAVEYHLFAPVPADQLRELSTDRPDITESPYTVDAGHFQIEMDLANYARDVVNDASGELRATSYGLAALNLKAGLLARLDLQLVLDCYLHTRSEDEAAGSESEASGLGDLQTRLKFNLWGNEGGRTAGALMPFIKWPLAASELRNGETEGGLILPVAVALPAGWSLGLMAELDFLRNADDDGYERETVGSITAGHDLAGALGGYAELVVSKSSVAGAEGQSLLGLGLTYGPEASLQFDGGCNLGLAEAAPDLGLFVGVSRRF